MKIWYALYTRPRFEKKAQHYLNLKGIESYLPLTRTKRKWSDRIKWVEEPLFKSYIFVCIEEKDYYEALNTPGIVRFVTFNSKAASIREQDIQFLHKLLDTEYMVEVVGASLEAGQDVKIERGPLTGFTGTLISYAGDKKVRVDVLHLEHSLLITVPVDYLSVL